MDEVIKKLLASEVFTDETRKQIKEAFESVVKQAQEEERKKVAEQYQNTRKQMIQAAQDFIEKNLSEVIAEYREGVAKTEALRKEYVDLMETVKKDAKKQVDDRIKMAEKFIRAQLTKELAEVHESEKTSRRAYLNAINAVETRAAETEANFKKKAALVMQEMFSNRLENILTEFQDDIRAAHKSDFGREVFEAFYATFRKQFFNSNKEFAALTDRVRVAEAARKKVETVAARKLDEANRRADAAEASRQKMITEGQIKTEKARLLKNLTGSTQAKMAKLLEGCNSVAEVQKQYKRFLPEMLNETREIEKKTSLKETAAKIRQVELRTGGTKPKQALTENNAQDDGEIVDIRRRAGIIK